MWYGLSALRRFLYWSSSNKTLHSKLNKALVKLHLPLFSHHNLFNLQSPTWNIAWDHKGSTSNLTISQWHVTNLVVYVFSWFQHDIDVHVWLTNMISWYSYVRTPLVFLFSCVNSGLACCIHFCANALVKDMNSYFLLQLWIK